MLFVLSPLLYVFASAATRRSVTIAMPVCDRHAHRGRWPLRLIAGGVALCALGCVVGFGLLNPSGRLGQTVLLGSFGILGVCLFGAICTTSNLKATAFDERSVTLDGVSKEFATAVKVAGDVIELDRAPGQDRRGPAPAGGTELMTAKYLR